MELVTNSEKNMADILYFILSTKVAELWTLNMLYSVPRYLSHLLAW